MSAAYVLDAVRTPFGRYGGALARRAARRPRRARACARCWTARRTSTRRGSTTCCSATPTAPARTTATSRGWRCCWPACRRRVPGATVNRLCGSSLEAAMQASRAIEAGDASIVLVGGVESMSRAPWVLLKPERALPARPRDAALDARSAGGWSTRRCPSSGRSRSARAPRSSPASTRSRARRRTSSRCAAISARPPAWDDGLLRRLGRAGPGHRARARRERSAPTRRWRSSPSSSRRSSKDGTVTAGNSSPLNDGAGALLLGDEDGARAARPRAAGPHRRARGAAASTRTSSASRPVEAANRALERAGIGWDDVDVVELNEAFASQSLACLSRVAGARPRQGQPERRRDRARPPARRVGRAHPRHARPRAARAAAAATASPRSASASARAWRWCWRHDD